MGKKGKESEKMKEAGEKKETEFKESGKEERGKTEGEERKRK